MNVSKLAPYAKAVVAVCGFIVLAAKTVVDGHITVDEIVAVATAAGVAVGVYQVPNKQ
jgi:hypothetical protein